MSIDDGRIVDSSSNIEDPVTIESLVDKTGGLREDNTSLLISDSNGKEYHQLRYRLYELLRDLLPPEKRRQIFSQLIFPMMIGGVILGYSQKGEQKPSSIVEKIGPGIEESNTDLNKGKILRINNPNVLQVESEYIQEVDNRDREEDKGNESEKQGVHIPDGVLTIVDSKNPIDGDYIIEEIEPNLVNITEEYPNIRVINENILISKVCIKDLNEMLTEAEQDGVVIVIRSGFRSIFQQRIAYNQASDKSLVTNPGESQHHTGLAIDFTSPEIGNIVDISAGFENTIAGKWLFKNAHLYGFVLSYTNNHEGIKNESWHYYYVGRDLAKIWFENRKVNKNYDLFDLQRGFSMRIKDAILLSELY